MIVGVVGVMQVVVVAAHARTRVPAALTSAQVSKARVLWPKGAGYANAQATQLPCHSHGCESRH
jgi:hypothetical protein